MSMHNEMTETSVLRRWQELIATQQLNWQLHKEIQMPAALVRTKLGVYGVYTSAGSIPNLLRFGLSHCLRWQAGLAMLAQAGARLAAVPLVGHKIPQDFTLGPERHQMNPAERVLCHDICFIGDGDHTLVLETIVGPLKPTLELCETVQNQRDTIWHAGGACVPRSGYFDCPRKWFEAWDAAFLHCGNSDGPYLIWISRNESKIGQYSNQKTFCHWMKSGLDANNLYETGQL